MRRASILAATAATLLACLPRSPARAHAGAGAFRIGADANVLAIRHYPDPDAFVAPEPTVIFGFYNAVAGVENALLFAPHIAYMVTADIVIGGHVGFAVASFLGSDVGYGFHILPFFEYLFGSGDLRPFVGAEVGPRITSIPSPGSDTEVTLLASGLGGVHIFPAESFSVSPFLRAGFQYYSGTERAGYEIVLGLSFAGWMGGESIAGLVTGGGSSAPEPAPEPAPAPPPPADPEAGMQ